VQKPATVADPKPVAAESIPAETTADKTAQVVTPQQK